MNIIYPTVRLARFAGKRVAAMDGRATLTYGELEEAIIRDARRLSASGVTSGDRVAIAASNSLDWVSLVHACARIGAILAPLNMRLTASDLRRQLQRLNPAVLIADHESASRLFVDDLDGSIQTILLDGTVSGWSTWNEMSPVACDVPESVNLDAVSTIIGTSGSSGEPKLVALTYGNHYFSSLASAIHLGHRETDRWLINLPLFHVGGLSIVHRAAVSGYSVFIQSGFSADGLLAAINDHDFTHLSVVGTMLQRILNEDDRACPDQVRAVLVGGGPVDRSLMEAAREAGYPVLATYGMTETASQAATQSPGVLSPSVEAVRPLPTCEIVVRDEDDTECTRGTAGRLWIRGPMVAAGYWQADCSIAPICEDGWFPTEDVGAIDHQGHLRVLGRCDDVIVSGGENVSLREIEETAIQCTGVSRVAALVVDDAEWGQGSVLCVEAVAPVDAGIVETFLRERLASFKLPRRVIVLDTLPTTELGKIDRAQLYQRIA